jgi:signal transduction histidine kinase
MKFLNRVNYLGKFTSLFILAGISLSTLILLILFAELSNYQHLSNLDKAKFEYTEKKKNITKFYDQYKRFLISLDENTLFLKYLTNPNQENHENLLSLFDTLINDKLEITQLRYIDEFGKEKIRIDRNFYGETPSIISEASLQDKSNRYYFKETMNLNQNMVFISKLNLNIENGKTEKPIKPVWRFAIPIIYENQKRGILIVNIFANQFLQELIQSNTFNIDIFDQDEQILVSSFENKAQWTKYLEKMPILERNNFILEDVLIDNINSEVLKIAFTPKDGALSFFKFINIKIMILIFVIFIISFILAYYLAKIPKKLFNELESQQKLILQQSKLSAMGEMIGMIAHQWRQPLNGISVLVQEIEIKKEMNLLDDKDFSFAIVNIKDTLNYMSKTINDFRDFFKPSKGKNEFNFLDCIQQSFNLSEVRLKDKNIDYKINYSKEINLSCFLVTSYESEIKQVFLNLINNSVDAFVNKAIENREIIVNLFCDEKEINIEFIDNAGGIDSQIFEDIFEPYSSSKEAEQGTGLGLYLSKMIIEKNIKGSIFVQNTKNGAMFKILIPKIGYELLK